MIDKERARPKTRALLLPLIGLLALCCLLLNGCRTAGPGTAAPGEAAAAVASEVADVAEAAPAAPAAPAPEVAASPDIPGEIGAESQQLAADVNKLRGQLEKRSLVIPDVEPVMPVYNPLDDQIVSFSIFEEDLRVVLYSLAKSVQMNLIIDPEISATENKITLNLEKVPASTVLKEVLKSFDLAYEIRGNVIYVRKMVKRVFVLNFLDTNVNTSFNLGGDVLGGSSISSGGLSGSFTMSGSSGKSGNPYDLVEQMINTVRSPTGKFSMNRLSGTLHVQDTPATVQTIAELIDHLKEMMDRQILIEAQIIEISLSDSYNYGIDWRYLRKALAASNVLLDTLSWNQGTGIVLNEGPGSANSFAAVINALKTFGDTRIISNPSIRAKHGQAAMISVGTSFTYVEKVTTTGGTTTDGVTTPLKTQPETANVFDGLILGVIPFIEDNGRISMLINPIKSDVDTASLQLIAMGGGEAISLPKVNIKELSSTISVNDNDIIILGGLIDRNRVSDKERVPVLADIPLLNLLFKNDYKVQEERELVMVLKVTIL